MRPCAGADCVLPERPCAAACALTTPPLRSRLYRRLHVPLSLTLLAAQRAAPGLESAHHSAQPQRDAGKTPLPSSTSPLFPPG